MWIEYVPQIKVCGDIFFTYVTDCILCYLYIYIYIYNILKLQFTKCVI